MFCTLHVTKESLYKMAKDYLYTTEFPGMRKTKFSKYKESTKIEFTTNETTHIIRFKTPNLHQMTLTYIQETKETAKGIIYDIPPETAIEYNMVRWYDTQGKIYDIPPKVAIEHNMFKEVRDPRE